MHAARYVPSGHKRLHIIPREMDSRRKGLTGHYSDHAIYAGKVSCGARRRLERIPTCIELQYMKQPSSLHSCSDLEGRRVYLLTLYAW